MTAWWALVIGPSIASALYVAWEWIDGPPLNDDVVDQAAAALMAEDGR